MMLRPEFEISLKRREERGFPFRYPALAPPHPVTPPSRDKQTGAGIAHFQTVAAGFQMCGGIENKPFAAISDASRKQIFAEGYAGDSRHQRRIDDYVDLNRLLMIGIVGSPSGDAC